MSSNQDLLATHQILSLFERSKALVEGLVDTLPGIFAVISPNGVVLKGNIGLATALGCDHEDLGDKPIAGLFREKTWSAFKNRLDEAQRAGRIEFELPVDGPGQTEGRTYFWTISVLDAMGKNPSANRRLTLLSVNGKDVTDLRQALELAKDIEVTKAVQALLLPTEQTIFLKSFHVFAHYEGAAQSSGDWWWYESLPGGRVRVLIGDVTGHGPGAAMVTAAVSGCYRATRFRSNAQQQEVEALSVFEALNANLCGMGGEFWMTMLAIELTPPKAGEPGKISWWTAGAPPFFVLNTKGEVETLVQIGSPLGSGPLKVGLAHRELKSGERVLVFTDGVYEIPTPAGPPLGRAGLRKVLADTFGQPADIAREKLVQTLRRLSEGQALKDDATFVLLDTL